MSTVATLTAANLTRWKKMFILPSREMEVERTASAICAPKAKAIYQQISQLVWGKPDLWWFVGVVHSREASLNFNDSLAQGDPWNEISRNVPRGIGPFPSFIAAAVFTLTKLAVSGGFIPAKWTDWSIGGVLTLFIYYNGPGYELYHNEPSPYDWGATSIEQEGKYTNDGIYNAKVWDTQVGCAALIKDIMRIDPSVKIEGA